MYGTCPECGQPKIVDKYGRIARNHKYDRLLGPNMMASFGCPGVHRLSVERTEEIDEKLTPPIWSEVAIQQYEATLDERDNKALEDARTEHDPDDLGGLHR